MREKEAQKALKSIPQRKKSWLISFGLSPSLSSVLFSLFALTSKIPSLLIPMSQHTHARTPPPLTPFLLPSILFAECDWSCNACKGPLRTDCLQCMEAYVLQEGVCTQGCSFGSYRDGDRCLGQSNKKQINWPTSHAVGAIVAAQRTSSGLLHCCLYICVHLKLFFLIDC